MSSELDTDHDATVTDGVGFEPTVTERQMKDAERIAEALVFASAQPVSESFIAERMPRGIDVAALMWKLKGVYSERGVNLIQVGETGRSGRRAISPSSSAWMKKSPRSFHVPRWKCWPSSPTTSR